MRKASLILSLTPFAIAVILLSVLFTVEGWAGLGVLVLIAFALPVLMVVSIIGLVLAFRKTENLLYDQAAKVISVISVCIFGSSGVLSLVFIVRGLLMSSSVMYGPGVTVHG